MIRRIALTAATMCCGLALGAGALSAGAAAQTPTPIGPPYLKPLVDSGKLPPVAERLPETPRIVHVGNPGKYGGTLHLVLGSSRDTRILVVYGYARLVTYSRDFKIHPDILKSVDNVGNRVFTFHLRKGMRWSDGAPFTTEDFRYWWEDVANNKMLSPIGPPQVMKVDGKPAKVDIIDRYTVRYSWDAPNPYFLPALASATPLYIYRPAHYLKQFHKGFADPKKLAELVKASGRRNWAALHNRKDNQYKNDNPKLPTLEPWVLRTKPPSQRFIFERNPYFFRVDQNGRQLPYIDRVAMSVASPGVIPLKTGAGESDLQARGIAFDNYTFLKSAEKHENFDVRLWSTAKGAHLALFPNLNVSDPVWHKLVNDVRFRRALSLAVNRHEINQVIFYGLGLEGQNTVLPGSPLYKSEYRTAWAGYDLKKANQLLDAVGLDKRDSDGIRLLPDGRRAEIVVETAGESTEQTDVLELVHDSWRKVGIKVFTRTSQREVFRNRIFSGATLMSIWSGHEFGLPNADTIPDEFAPTSQLQLQWPKWGQYFQTGGRAGVKPDDPAAIELLRLNHQWIYADDEAQRRAIWEHMLRINAKEVYTIGLISAVPQPVVVNRALRNVPKDAVFNWNPGAQFGVYMPDTFWFDSAKRRHTEP